MIKSLEVFFFKATASALVGLVFPLLCYGCTQAINYLLVSTKEACQSL